MAHPERPLGMSQWKCEGWDPTTLMDFPPVGTFCGNFSIPRWIEEEFGTGEIHRNVDAFYVLSVVGTIHRLWVPNAEEKSGCLQHLMDGTDISTHLRCWVQKLPDEFLTHAESLALCEAFWVGDDLDSMDPEDPEFLFLCAERRDVLEGIFECLRWVGKGKDLGAQLQLLDQRANCMCSLIHGFKTFCLPISPRLWGVSWQYPDAWWGKLIH